MSLPTLRRIGQVLANSRCFTTQDRLEVLWHAGEPLAAGLSFYRQAHAVFLEYLPGCKVEPTFQTNATLITPEWCNYFIESGAKVGVSIDGPEDIHDPQRSRRNGKGSFQEAMRGVELLRANGIGLSALCVLTLASLCQPKRIFDFFLSREIFHVAFNVEETEGEHLASSLIRIKTASIDESYSVFMQRFLEENEKHNSPIVVREFQALAQRLISKARDPSYYPVEPENEFGRVLTISREGEVFSWSPELASGHRGDTAVFSLGNVHAADSFEELLTSPKALEIQSEIDRGIEECRRTCEYFCVCGGGLPSNKFYENGSFNSTDTLRCRLQVQQLAEIFLKHFALASNGALLLK